MRVSFFTELNESKFLHRRVINYCDVLLRRNRNMYYVAQGRGFRVSCRPHMYVRRPRQASLCTDMRYVTARHRMNTGSLGRTSSAILIH